MQSHPSHDDRGSPEGDAHPLGETRQPLLPRGAGVDEGDCAGGAGGGSSDARTFVDFCAAPILTGPRGHASPDATERALPASAGGDAERPRRGGRREGGQGKRGSRREKYTAPPTIRFEEEEGLFDEERSYRSYARPRPRASRKARRPATLRALGDHPAVAAATMRAAALWKHKKTGALCVLGVLLVLALDRPPLPSAWDPEPVGVRGALLAAEGGVAVSDEAADPAPTYAAARPEGDVEEGGVAAGEASLVQTRSFAALPPSLPMVPEEEIDSGEASETAFHGIFRRERGGEGKGKHVQEKKRAKQRLVHLYNDLPEAEEEVDSGEASETAFHGIFRRQRGGKGKEKHVQERKRAKQRLVHLQHKRHTQDVQGPNSATLSSAALLRPPPMVPEAQASGGERSFAALPPPLPQVPGADTAPGGYAAAAPQANGYAVGWKSAHDQSPLSPETPALASLPALDAFVEAPPPVFQGLREGPPVVPAPKKKRTPQQEQKQEQQQQQQEKEQEQQEQPALWGIPEDQAVYTVVDAAPPKTEELPEESRPADVAPPEPRLRPEDSIMSLLARVPWSVAFGVDVVLHVMRRLVRRLASWPRFWGKRVDADA